MRGSCTLHHITGCIWTTDVPMRAIIQTNDVMLLVLIQFKFAVWLCILLAMILEETPGGALETRGVGIALEVDQVQCICEGYTSSSHPFHDHHHLSYCSYPFNKYKHNDASYAKVWLPTWKLFMILQVHA